MAKVNLVIPIYNNWEMTHTQLWNLYRKEKENIDYLLVVDDCSPDEDVQQGLKWWRAEWKEKADPLPIFTYTSPKNVGFLLSSNEAIQVISGDDEAEPDDIIILLSSDVLIHGQFIEQIREILSAPHKSLVGGILYSHDTGWNKFGDRIYPYLEGWLLATTVSNWKELGYFDEQFAPCIFEDVDLSATAQSLGYELVPLNNPALHHLSGQTIKYTKERDTLTKINQEKFRLKWIKEN